MTKRDLRITARDEQAALWKRGFRAPSVPIGAKVERRVIPTWTPRRLARYRPCHPAPGTKPKPSWWKRNPSSIRHSGSLKPTGVKVAYHGGYDLDGTRKADQWR